METAYNTLVLVHVLTGSLGLLSLALPLAARKGSRLHRRAGWLFSLAMAISMTTALAVSTTWVAAPYEVARWKGAVADPQRLADSLRAFGLFFGVLGLMGAHALASGLAAIGRRGRRWPWLHPLARRLAVGLVVISPIVLALGVSHTHPLLMAVGALGTWSGIDALRSRVEPGSATVLVAHVESMLGVATVATTAFFVQLTSRAGADQFALWIWAVPIIVGHLATVLWRRRVRAGNYTA